MESEPVIGPLTAGLKVRETVQEAPTASVDPQALGPVIVKSPVAEMELMFTVLELVFFSVTDFDALVVPASCWPKPRLKGVGLTMGLLATLNGKAAKAAQRKAPLGKFSTKTWIPPGVFRSVEVIATVSVFGLTSFEA